MVSSDDGSSAVLGMKVEDVYAQQRRLRVRLREKGGTADAMASQPMHDPYLAQRVPSPPTRLPYRRTVTTISARQCL